MCGHLPSISEPAPQVWEKLARNHPIVHWVVAWKSDPTLTLDSNLCFQRVPRYSDPNFKFFRIKLTW